MNDSSENTPSTPPKRRNGLVPTLALGLLLALVIGGWQFVQQQQDTATRQELNRLLPPAEPLPRQATPGPWEQWLREPLARLPQTLMEMGSGVRVNETPQAYVLEIPIQNPEDAAQVKVEAGPHHVQVSGSHAVGEHGRTSFFQSFTSPAELQPDAMTRQAESDVLIITIPKKKPGAAAAPPTLPQAPLHGAPINPEALQELKAQEARSI